MKTTRQSIRCTPSIRKSLSRRISFQIIRLGYPSSCKSNTILPMWQEFQRQSSSLFFLLVECLLESHKVLFYLISYLIFFHIPAHPKVLTALYAGDIALISSRIIMYSSSHIQKNLSTLQNWYFTWRLQINENK